MWSFRDYMKAVFKRIASKLPIRIQQELKRYYFSYLINCRQFMTTEDEFFRLGEWLDEGDWVIDVGANVGHYTLHVSEIVGRTGRVIAIEPVPETFELLVANIACSPVQNVTLLNIAASDAQKIAGISIPKFGTGLRNYYQAQLTEEDSILKVLCLPIDSLNLPHPVKLVKIDAEGHDLSVLKGMENLLTRDHPTLIVENNSPELISFLAGFGYVHEKSGRSPNLVFPQRRKIKK
jgi:FkbM family methyltransferase